MWERSHKDCLLHGAWSSSQYNAHSILRQTEKTKWRQRPHHHRRHFTLSALPSLHSSFNFDNDFSPGFQKCYGSQSQFSQPQPSLTGFPLRHFDSVCVYAFVCEWHRQPSRFCYCCYCCQKLNSFVVRGDMATLALSLHCQVNTGKIKSLDCTTKWSEG